MAERMAARLAAQERQIEALGKEIGRLRDGLISGHVAAELASSAELENLRSENEKLKYRLVHLRRGLQAEQELETKGGHEKKSKENSQKAGKEAPKESAPKKVGAVIWDVLFYRPLR